MIIRKAVKQDLPQLQVMYEAIIAHMYAQQICIWDAVYPCICFPEDIKQERMYVLQKDARILAAFALCEHNKGGTARRLASIRTESLYLDRLGVHVDAMGKGVGRAAIREAMRCAKERQADVLRLFAVDSNTPAIRLYEKNGFIQAKGIYHEVIDDTLTLHELGFEKAITEKELPG